MSGDPAATARQIIEGVTYMTLATADENGRPWASPVWFAHSPDFDEFFWVSHHEALHSLNIAARPQVSLVIFDSRAARRGAGRLRRGQRLHADEGDDLNAGIEIFSNAPSRRESALGRPSTSPPTAPSACTGRPPSSTGSSTRTTRRLAITG